MPHSLLDVLLPPACASCGRSGTVLCVQCASTFRPPSDPADRFIAADAGVVLGDALSVAISALAYEGALRQALQKLKYGGAARVADPLAKAVLPTLQRVLAVTGRATLVPIPVHPIRARERGYNQAALLANGLARLAGLPVAEPLVRVRETAKQHRLDRAGRLQNLRDAFALHTGARAPPVVVLVDDIMTTSATLEACAAVLVRAGSAVVAGLTVAREV